MDDNDHYHCFDCNHCIWLFDSIMDVARVSAYSEGIILMRRGAFGLTFLVLIIVSIVGGTVFTQFLFGTAGTGKEGTDNVVQFVNESLGEKEELQQAMVESAAQISAGLTEYIGQLNNSLRHAMSRNKQEWNKPCIWRIPETDIISDADVYIRLFMAEIPDSQGNIIKGTRVMTSILQQPRDYYTIEDLRLCSVSGSYEGFCHECTVSRHVTRERSEVFYKWWMGTDGFRSHNNAYEDVDSITIVKNAGEDNDQNFIAISTMPDYKMNLDYGSGDSYGGNYLFSPRKGKVCIIPSYDLGGAWYTVGINWESLHQNGVHPSWIKAELGNYDKFDNVIPRDAQPPYDGGYSFGWDAGAYLEVCQG